jgi:integrase
MGVKVVERIQRNGDIAFSIDTYHKAFGRFRQVTGLRANPQDKKALKEVRAAAEDKRREIERQFMRDPAAVFSRKEMAANDFRAYFIQYSAVGENPAYTNVIPILERFTGGGDIPFESMNNVWLERFKAYLLSIDKISQNTAACYFQSVRAVIRKAFREGFIEQDFTGRVAGIKKINVKINHLTAEQVHTLSIAPCKNEMIKQAFLFACFTGLRISDIESMRWEQINLINGDPWLEYQQVKTKKHERLPLHETAVSILQTVRVLHTQYAPDGSTKVFILPTRSRIEQVLHIWGAVAALPFQLHFHVSRHTFATAAVTQGVDVYTVSKLLGHTNISTTQRYIELIGINKQAAVQRIRPLPVQPVVLKPSRSNTILEALQEKGQKVASALGLQPDKTGQYLFDGRSYTAVELAIEVSSG